MQDADALLAAGRWGAAYYLLGYSVECALKACVARQFLLHEVPEKKLVNSFYTHRLDELLTISGVKSQLESRSQSDSGFKVNWRAVLGWSEAVRYEVDITEARAREMYEAVTNSTTGILPWLKIMW